jgi:hypothetical protein
MARDEIAGRQKRGPREDGKPIPTGEDVTEERRRDHESADGRAGGTGRIVARDEEDVPRRTPGTDGDKKGFDGGGI